MPDTKALLLPGRFDLGFPHGDDRHGLTDGIEDFQLITGFLTGGALILLDHGGKISPAQAMRGHVLSQDDVGKEFVFHEDAG